MDESLGTAENEQNCASKVKQKRPTATGATFYPISKRCFAEYFLSLEIVKVQFYARGCIFIGIAQIKFGIDKLPFMLSTIHINNVLTLYYRSFFMLIYHCTENHISGS